MTSAGKPWWRNCAVAADPEILEIDAMEDRIGPIDAKLSGVRELISSLELCHHKADRWVFNVIEAIGACESDKGLGTRPPGSHHPVEAIWQNACAALAAWCAGLPSEKAAGSVGGLPAPALLACLGERSPLKEWQVQRVIEKIRSLIQWPQPLQDPTAQYTWLMLGGGEYGAAYRTTCPEQYEEHEDHWLTTVRTLILDTVDGEEARLSLGVAIDMLWPCHWRFVENLQIVLAAIGGNLEPESPFTACGRNIGLSPHRPRMQVVSNTLRAFCDALEAGGAVDRELLSLLGEPTDAKKWLALSLDKTIRLQLDPPENVRALSLLAGPDWLDQQAGSPDRAHPTRGRIS